MLYVTAILRSLYVSNFIGLEIVDTDNKLPFSSYIRNVVKYTIGSLYQSECIIVLLEPVTQVGLDEPHSLCGILQITLVGVESY